MRLRPRATELGSGAYRGGFWRPDPGRGRVSAAVVSRMLGRRCNTRLAILGWRRSHATPVTHRGTRDVCYRRLRNVCGTDRNAVRPHFGPGSAWAMASIARWAGNSWSRARFRSLGRGIPTSSCVDIAQVARLIRRGHAREHVGSRFVARRARPRGIRSSSDPAGLLDVWPRGRADAVSRRGPSAARLAPAADASDPGLVWVFHGVPAGSRGRRVVAARADLGARSDGEPLRRYGPPESG
jgi:hypothetical protein